MQEKMIDYGNIPEEEVQAYKTWQHTRRGIVAKDLSNTMRISCSSAGNKLNSSVRSGSLIFRYETRDYNHFAKVYYPTEELKDRIRNIEEKEENKQ